MNSLSSDAKNESKTSIENDVGRINIETSSNDLVVSEFESKPIFNYDEYRTNKPKRRKIQASILFIQDL